MMILFHLVWWSWGILIRTASLNCSCLSVYDLDGSNGIWFSNLQFKPSYHCCVLCSHFKAHRCLLCTYFDLSGQSGMFITFSLDICIVWLGLCLAISSGILRFPMRYGPRLLAILIYFRLIGTSTFIIWWIFQFSKISCSILTHCLFDDSFQLIFLFRVHIFIVYVVQLVLTWYLIWCCYFWMTLDF